MEYFNHTAVYNLAGFLQDTLTDPVFLGRVWESVPEVRGDTNALTVVARLMMIPGFRETIAGAVGDFVPAADGKYAEASAMKLIGILATMYLAGCTHGVLAAP